MKLRNGFVSNSSSSSFVVMKEKMTEQQIEQMRLICDVINAMDMEDSDTRETNKGFDIQCDYSINISSLQDYVHKKFGIETIDEGYLEDEDE